MVNGCNTYFLAFENEEELRQARGCAVLSAFVNVPQAWPGLGANQTSVGDLMIGFFEYLLAFPLQSSVR